MLRSFSNDSLARGARMLPRPRLRPPPAPHVLRQPRFIPGSCCGDCGTCCEAAAACRPPARMVRKQEASQRLLR